MATAPRLQDVLEAVQQLAPEEQAILIEIVHKRLVQGRRAEIAEEIKAAREAYRRGDVRRGTVEDLLADIVS